VMKNLDKVDTMLIVGTAFYTTLARNVVTSALWKRINIIEVNRDSILANKGRFMKNIVSLESKCEEMLP